MNAPAKWHTEQRISHPSFAPTQPIVCPIHNAPCVQVAATMPGYNAFECAACTKAREAAELEAQS